MTTATETPAPATPPTPAKPKSKKAAKCIVLAAICVGAFYLFKGHEAGKGSTPVEKPVPALKAQDVNIPEAIAMGGKIEDLISKQGTLPERSPLGLEFLGESQESSAISMNKNLETLAIELGSSRALGSIRTLNKLRDESRLLEDISKSSEPETAGNAKSRLQANQSEQKQLIKEITRSFEKEGIPLTEDQVTALCMSPNAEDTASLISAFSSLKAISLEMEDRLRAMPTQAMAQKYYGTHYVMLMGLDRIQRRVIEGIVKIHIPKTEEILAEAQFRADEAAKLLQTKSQDLGPSEREALTVNQNGCRTTIVLAERAKEKLKENLAILLAANNKLQASIQTAQNSHATALLQKEIIALAKNHSEEIAKIQCLTIPELAAINFADPTSPTISPKRNLKPL